jgi:hypothetical protein
LAPTPARIISFNKGYNKSQKFTEVSAVDYDKMLVQKMCSKFCLVLGPKDVFTAVNCHDGPSQRAEGKKYNSRRQAAGTTKEMLRLLITLSLLVGVHPWKCHGLLRGGSSSSPRRVIERTSQMRSTWQLNEVGSALHAQRCYSDDSIPASTKDHTSRHFTAARGVALMAVLLQANKKAAVADSMTVKVATSAAETMPKWTCVYSMPPDTSHGIIDSISSSLDLAKASSAEGESETFLSGADIIPMPRPS